MKKIIFLITYLAAQVVSGQVDQQKNRPVVGICLSGGGAKGFAHIGVLEIIDSLGIPIDYVSGTSMGSIVGALYSIGYTPKQIDDEVSQADWDELMSPDPQRKYISYSTKDYTERNLFTVGLKDWKVALPSGLNNASKVYQKFHYATIGYHGNQNFLTFPRGFVCIGADLNRGDEIVFDHGSLPDAMRASMSIPTVFTPHRYNGKTLVDGGTINNLPTDKLIELGCDIIIGVDLQTQMDDTTTISLTKVLEKSAMFINNKGNLERQELCDILIRPDLSGYTGKSFDKGIPIIERGKQAARKNMPALLELSKQLSQSARKEVKPYSKPDTVLISQVEAKGLQWVSKSYVLGMVDVEKNEPKAISELEDAMAAMYGSGYFEHAVYNLLPKEDGTYTLEVVVLERSVDADLGFGLHYDPDFETSFLLNASAFNLFIKGSRLNVDAIIAPRPRFRFLYEVDRGFKPGFGLRSNGYFIQPNYYVNNITNGKYRFDDWSTAIYLLSTINNLAIIRVGVEYNNAFINLKNIPAIREVLDPTGENPLATEFYFSHVNLFAEIGLDVLDNINYPTKGQKLEAQSSYHFGTTTYLNNPQENNFLTLYGKYIAAISANSWLTFIPEGVGGVSFFNDPSFNYSFFYGGLGKNYFNYQTTFLGYHYLADVGLNNIVKAGIEMRANPFKNHYLSAMYNYGTSFYTVKDPDTQKDILKTTDLKGFGFKYSYNSFLGPVEVTAHKNLAGGPWLIYLNIGYWF